MPQVLTVSCKLTVTPQQVEKLDAVLSAFARCCEFVNAKTPEKLTNQIAVQSLIYKESRAHSGLSAQMTIHAIRRVCANRKTAKQKGRPVQTCHCCKVIGNRQGKKFECLNKSCGWVGDADVNGAKNIATLGVLVNNPGGSGMMSCSLRDVVLRATESPRCIA
jgi:predicted transposase